MDDLTAILVGLFLLVIGAEALVRCSTSIAARLGIPALVVGLTIVAFGTSAPEAVASIAAALRQSPGIAVGNIVGSNITNSLLVAGAAASIAPIAVTGSALTRDCVVALLAAVVFWLICALQVLNAGTGIALLLALVLYIFWSYRAEAPAESPSSAVGGGRLPTAQAGGSSRHLERFALPLLLLGAAAGAALLAVGGEVLIGAAINLSVRLGRSEAVIGLTVVAVGTSLPELATSMLAALRGKPDIAFGNIVGSNIFNLLGIGGLTAVLSQQEVPARIVTIDMPIMLGATALLVVFAATRHRIVRVEGLLLVGAFGIFLASVWLVGV